MGRLRTVRWLADPFVSVGFPMPKVSFLPIFILWFGYDLSKILLTTVAAVFPIVAATHAGVAGVDRSLLWVGQNLKMREGRIFLRIVLPAILPQIFNGLQIAFPVGLIVVVVTEMLTGGRGVGTVMMMGARFGDSPAVFAGLVLVAALGLASLKGLAAIRARLLRWHQETRAAEMAAA
ncbi:MAG: ABC transporter permease subunit [Deltaproteobacteria bacterium]|nr:ABC transporter permease subunit [Deltaproteobacteria bacterium]